MKKGHGYSGPGKSVGSVRVGQRPVKGPSYHVPNDSGKGRQGCK